MIVRAFTHPNMNISKQLSLRTGRIRTLIFIFTDSSHRVINGKTLSLFFWVSIDPIILNLQVTRIFMASSLS